MGKPRPKCPDCGCTDPPKSLNCYQQGFPDNAFAAVWGGNESTGIGGSDGAGLAVHSVKNLSPDAFTLVTENYAPNKRSGPVFDFIDADNYHALLMVPQSSYVDADYDLVRVENGVESIVETITLPTKLSGVNKRATGFYAVSQTSYPHQQFLNPEEYSLSVSAFGGRFVGLRTDDAGGDSFFWRYFFGDSARHMCYGNRGVCNGQIPQNAYGNFGAGGLTDGDCALCDDLAGVFNLTWQISSTFNAYLTYGLGSCNCALGSKAWTIRANAHSRDGQEYLVARVCLANEQSTRSPSRTGNNTSTCPRATAIYESALYDFETFENNSGFPVSLSLVDSYIKDWCGGSFPASITISV